MGKEAVEAGREWKVAIPAGAVAAGETGVPARADRPPGRPSDAGPGPWDARERAFAAGISLVIAVVLFLQTVTAFDLTFGPFQPAPYQYPFVDYPMYSSPRYETDRVERLRVVAVFADGSERQVLPEELGLSFWRFQRGPVAAIRSRSLEGTRLLTREYEGAVGMRPVLFRLEAEPLIAGSDGIEVGAPRLVRMMPVPLP